jgi:hypothetical protein
MPKAKGVIARDKKGLTRGSKGVPRVDEPATLKELGIADRKRAARAKRLAALSREVKSKMRFRGENFDDGRL